MRMRSLGVLLVACLLAALPGGAGATTAVSTLPPGVDLPAEGCETKLLGPLTRDPVGTAPCPGVRPGAYVRTDLGGCTFNFLFRGSDKRTYIGTAGHCILEDDGESIWRGRKGPEARDSSNTRIGTFVYAVLSDTQDFGLIRLDKGVKSEPGMCYWGGPTKADKGEPASGTLLRHFGQGLVYGDTLPARTGRIRTVEPDTIYADGAAIFGDSGSAVIEEDGTARGILVNLQILPHRGMIGVTRLKPQVQEAAKHLRVKLRLRTAKLER